ncbi:uncharacterized protein LOC135687738 [Rhopilema esculentum]|uniref:uncharacterized protein LOC135687738 n=1 Tax=Rhopilema esculentum TaxID=499914 RepID=UPI0031D70C59
MDSEVSSSGVVKKSSLGKQCAAFGCYNFSYRPDGTPTGLHFFKFPQRNPEKRLWCNLIKRVDGLDGFKVTESTRLCQEHFKDSDIKRNPMRWKLNPGAAPSLKLYTPPVSGERSQAVRKKPRDRSSTDVLGKPSSSMSSTSVLLPTCSSNSSLPAVDEEMTDSLAALSIRTVATQTDFSFVKSPTFLESCLLPSEGDHDYSPGIPKDQHLLNFIELKEKVEKLSTQISDLNEELAATQKKLFSIKKIQDDDSAVRFYTGFANYSSLCAVFEYFEPKLQKLSYWRGHKASSKPSEESIKSSKRGRKRKLSHFQEFIFVLIRLKVGLFLVDLADRFGISVGHASKIFTTWINFLYHELPILFPFPSKDLVKMNMPEQFKRYPSTRIIIDCTEIFIEVPSSLVAQLQTWSEYKHHNTWKALVGIAPSGAITFISKLWSGRVSDKEITLKSGLLSLLDPGDNVMADRGFDIAEILPPGVTLNIPPFKGTRDQLTPEEVEETAHIASVRIHVERAIGRVKTCHILDGVMPLTLSSISDQIFTVCCYLTNFSPVLVRNS